MDSHNISHIVAMALKKAMLSIYSFCTAGREPNHQIWTGRKDYLWACIRSAFAGYLKVILFVRPWFSLHRAYD